MELPDSHYQPPTTEELQRQYKRLGKDVVNEANRLAKANNLSFRSSLRIVTRNEPEPRRRFEDW